MAFTVTFPATSPTCATSELAGWLTERGEPSVAEGDDTLILRALPIRFVASPDNASLQAHLEITSNVALTRMVDVLFEVSMRAGADVRLVGHGEVTRSDLWMLLADEQDRLRIAGALRRAVEHGHSDEVYKRMWGVLSTLRVGQDDRWDTASERIVEYVEVGDGISLEEAAWHTEDPQNGDQIRIPVKGFLHCLVWRWLSEAYPGIAEAEHTLH
ncbi:MAG TPA: hypothetical protein ENK18_27645 [Deltaproteobacteria bacterium]|nr:hypothetical protein [Deltaproteobacteria bacterium]